MIFVDFLEVGGIYLKFHRLFMDLDVFLWIFVDSVGFMLDVVGCSIDDLYLFARLYLDVR